MITRFRDIPQLTRPGNWECDFDIDGAWAQIERWQREQGTAPLDIDPDFQRPHVWTEEQQIAWLEFLMRGGKTGRTLYFNCEGWMRDWRGPFVIVDGKQRLRAIERFLKNEIPVFGSFRRDFTDSLLVIDSIKFNVNSLPNRKSVLQWYLEFNTGGTPHTNEEIGRVRELLQREAV